MPPVRVSFRRHAEKTRDGSKLTTKGKKDSKRLGENLSKEPTKFYWDVNRTKETAEELDNNKKYTSRKREILHGHKYLTPDVEIKTKADKFLVSVKRILEKAGIVNDNRLMAIWLNGNFPKSIVPKPEVIADRIIKDRFALPNRINKRINHIIVFENITHDIVIAALFQRLSGIKYTKSFKGEFPKELEALTIEISKEGKAIMQFRNYKKDITERLKYILSN